ncbi:MAG: DUF4129 domain-containing protein, partial [Actinobacteria bacterium]|nr:DUF4129 domain-containing protein [Actinomycetota bacterium]
MTGPRAPGGLGPGEGPPRGLEVEPPAPSPSPPSPAPPVGRSPGSWWSDERRSAIPAGLQAIAESGVLFLPVSLFATESIGATGGPLTSFPWFLALFVGTVVVAATLRRLRGVSVAVALSALALGVIQTVGWSTGDRSAGVITVIGTLLVGLRAASLALRDWRNPSGAAFAGGTIALLVEVSIGPRHGWAGLLPLTAGLFFAGSLASRAATLTLFGGEGGARHPAPRRAVVLAAMGVGALGVVIGAASAIGGDGGLIEAAGRLVNPIVEFLAGIIVFVLVQLTRPFLWLAERLGADGEGVRRVLERIDEALGGDRREDLVPGDPVLLRVLGFLLLALIAAAILWAIRRQRDRLQRAAAIREGGSAEEERVEGLRRPRRRVLHRVPRRELPADVVRRWYAEMLLLLERRGLNRDPWATPDEFLARVAAAVPVASRDVEALTR